MMHGLVLLVAALVGVVEANPEKTFILPGGAEIEMVWIEPGTFMMGTSPDEAGLDTDDEEPQHQVTITKGFYLGKYEITQGQWNSVMGTRPWAGQTGVQENPSNPAAYISWDDMQALIDTLTAHGLGGFRLPTEAEREYTCRAGTTTLWSFGDDESQLGQYAWYDDNACDVGECYAHTVGTKVPNPWGLHDMYGNVWEWCQDWYGDTYYSVSPDTDPTGPATSAWRCLRGGAFDSAVRGTRSANRGSYSSHGRRSFIGARLVRQEPPLYGDVTGNGDIASLDASWVLQHAVGSRTLAGRDSTAADVSGNGEITPYDASLILRYVVGDITIFPVENDDL